MYGEFILLEEASGAHLRAPRLPLGETQGRGETWLRNLLFHTPEIIPVADIDPSFGPLVPLCRELRTEAGQVDLVLVNRDGLLTLVECKLWRNPEARRKVVAQILDYARTIAGWTYSDLQREVARATRRSGNVPFDLVHERYPDLEEHRFVDAVSRSMRFGRFSLLVAGDGIREGVGALAELINRNAALGFSFGLFEVALYDMGTTLAIQSRTLARTSVLHRIEVSNTGAVGSVELANTIADEPPAERRASSVSRVTAADLLPWWEPLLVNIKFDDPDQEPPRYVHPNQIRALLPWPHTWVNAFRNSPRCGVYVAGREQPMRELMEQLNVDDVLRELPAGTELSMDHGYGFIIRRNESDFASADDERRWLGETMNAFVNALRFRLRKLDRSQRSA